MGEILDFDFAPLTLHALGCSRIIKNNDILVTTLDYQSWNLLESTQNDEWFNIQKFQTHIIGGMVLSIQLSPWNDLHIILDNGIRIECLIANAYPHYEEEQEQWVLFEKRKHESKPFLTVYNKRMKFVYD